MFYLERRARCGEPGFVLEDRVVVEKSLRRLRQVFNTRAYVALAGENAVLSLLKLHRFCRLRHCQLAWREEASDTTTHGFCSVLLYRLIEPTVSIQPVTLISGMDI